MTRSERAAYNAGVYAALAQARYSAAAIEQMPGFKSTRAGFAVVALEALADASEELLLPIEPEHGNMEADHA